MDSKYTIAQETYLEGMVTDFDYAVSRGNYQEATTIILELRGRDYEEPANRLAQELARKRLSNEK